MKAKRAMIEAQKPIGEVAGENGKAEVEEKAELIVV